MTQPPGSANGQADDFSLGVLFVHGIGEQQQFSTLSRFGGALQRWLRQWEEGRQPAQAMTVKRWQTCLGRAKQPEPTSTSAGPKAEPSGTRQTATGTRS